MTSTASSRAGQQVDARRPRRIMLVLVGAPLLWALLELAWAAAGTPAAPVDYAKDLAEMSGRYQQPGENGWPALETAGLRAEQILTSLRAEAGELGTGPDRRPNLSLLLSAAADEAAWPWELRALEEMRRDGVFALLAEAAACPRFVRVIPDEESLLELNLPNVSRLRSLARARVGSMRLALLRGDAAEAVAAFEQSLAIARALHAQVFLIDRLVAIASARLVLDQLRLALDEHVLDAATYRAMAEAMDRQTPFAPVSVCLEGERSLVLQSVDLFYSDDGHGNGAFRPRSAGGALGGVGRGRLAGLLELTFQADRAETTALVYELFDLLLAEAEQRPVDRAQANLAASAQFWAKLDWRHRLLQQMLPTTGRVLGPDDDVRMLVAGTRVMLALEEHRAAHGTYPQTIDELVPELLAAPPVDPTTGGPFRYLPPGDDGRYLLYSIGADGVDDRANPPAPQIEGGAIPNTFGNGVWDSGADVIVNIRREEEEP